jgi:hypothetical protein
MISQCLIKQKGLTGNRGGIVGGLSFSRLSFINSAGEQIQAKDTPTSGRKHYPQ